MISRSLIEELRDKWQTTEHNVAREYAQHVLLSALYRDPRRKARLAFKGGTALRLLGGSPRFSEDLDFSAWGKAYHVGEALKETLAEAGRAGLEFSLEDSAPTSGGWFASMRARVHDWPVRVEWNVSLRGGAEEERETVLVSTPLWAAYSVQSLPAGALAAEKVAALLARAKPRDFYDLYFILRKPWGERKSIAARREAILSRLDRLSPKALYDELKLYLPKSHWPIIRDLPAQLRKELERV